MAEQKINSQNTKPISPNTASNKGVVSGVTPPTKQNPTPINANNSKSNISSKNIAPQSTKTNIPTKDNQVTTKLNQPNSKPSTAIKNINQNTTSNFINNGNEKIPNLAVKTKKEKKKDRRWLIILLLLLLIALIGGAVILITQLTKTPPPHLFQNVEIELQDYEMQKLEHITENVNPGDRFSINAKLINKYDPVYIRFSLVMMGTSATGLPLTVTEVTFDDLYYTNKEGIKTYLLKGDTLDIGNGRKITYFYGSMTGGEINPMNESLLPFEVQLDGKFDLQGEYFNNEWQNATLSIKFVVEAIEQYRNIDLTASRSKVVDAFEEIFVNFQAENT